MNEQITVTTVQTTYGTVQHLVGNHEGELRQDEASRVAHQARVVCEFDGDWGGLPIYIYERARAIIYRDGAGDDEALERALDELGLVLAWDFEDDRMVIARLEE